MSKSLRALAATLLLGLAGTGTARAQELVDWTVRTRAEPEALSTGTEAVFWNPAGIGMLAGRGERGEALVAALQSSDALGLKGFAAAGAFRLPRGGTAIGVGYQHFGIDNIEHTGVEPPDQGTADLIGVGEDRMTLGAAQPLGSKGYVGGLVEYDRSDSGAQIKTGFTFGAGVLLRGGGRLQPELGATGVALSGSTRWRAGVGAMLPLSAALPASVRASYGITGQSDRPGRPAHRLALTGDWHQRVILSLAGMAEKSDGTTAYTPEALAEFHVGRYLLGVVYDALPNGFGAATSVHLGMRF